MKRTVKRLLPIFLCLVIIFSIVWYLFSYDRGFMQDILLGGARFFEHQGNHSIATWLYNQAYLQSGNDVDVIIELANRFKKIGNYTQAEVTLSSAIAEGGSAQLYIALSKTYVEQDKLLDAANMLENITNPDIKAELDALRPASPVASPAPGFYSQYLNVSIAADDTSRLYITTNGDFPSTQNTYQDSVNLVAGENAIYAISVGENGLVSQPAFFGYTVGGVIEEISISDPVLDKHLRELLEMDADTPLFSNDLWKITSLTVPEGAESYVDLGRLTFLESLEIDNVDIDNLQMLSSMTQLKNLTIRNMPVSASSLAVIAALPNLENLVLSNCSLSNITNLSKASKLVNLDLSGNAIADVSALSFMEKLTTLDLKKNALTNLSALSGLNSLTTLDVSYNSLTSIAPLATCKALSGLIVNNNQLSEIPVFNDPTVLTILTASNNQISNVDALAQYTNLVGLSLSYNNLTDVSSLAGLKKLTSVDFSHNQISTLPTWSKDSLLVVIDGSYNKITSVAPLRGLMYLNQVILDYNKITNINPLAECSLMVQVDVYGNSIKDVSKLTDMSIIVNYKPK